MRNSAEIGREIAALLDKDKIVKSVSNNVRGELKTIGLICRVGGGNLNPAEGDLKITAHWGTAGKGGITMPGKGKLIERDYTDTELSAITEGATALGMTADQVIQQLGAKTYDVYLNNVAYWQNVPARVWEIHNRRLPGH